MKFRKFTPRIGFDDVKINIKKSLYGRSVLTRETV